MLIRFFKNHQNNFKPIIKAIIYMLVVLTVAVGCFYLYLISQSQKQGDVTWHSCYRPAYLSWFTLPPSIHLQCATVNVPVDYAKPNGKTFDIPLTRLPSQSKNPIGDLLLLNGGPGGHSLDMSMTTWPAI